MTFGSCQKIISHVLHTIHPPMIGEFVISLFPPTIAHSCYPTVGTLVHVSCRVHASWKIDGTSLYLVLYCTLPGNNHQEECSLLVKCYLIGRFFSTSRFFLHKQVLVAPDLSLREISIEVRRFQRTFLFKCVY